VLEVVVEELDALEAVLGGLLQLAGEVVDAGASEGHGRDGWSGHGDIYIYISFQRDIDVYTLFDAFGCCRSARLDWFDTVCQPL